MNHVRVGGSSSISGYNDDDDDCGFNDFFANTPHNSAAGWQRGERERGRGRERESFREKVVISF
jgi:hypothetical protein